MNYIGSKQTLLPFIDECIEKVTNNNFNTFCDIFAGTGSVGIHYKKKGYSVIANDLQFFAYTRLKHYIENCNEYDYVFRGKEMTKNEFIEHMNSFLETSWQNYSNTNLLQTYCNFANGNYQSGGRLYFSAENAKMIDGMRRNIFLWVNNKEITEELGNYLLTMLIEASDRVANVASIYGAYLKKLKATALKKIHLVEPELILSNKKCETYNEDANKLIRNIKCDVLYLDPPYNHRQYASNYHVLETIATYDFSTIKGITGVRDWHNQKSDYCLKNKAYTALKDLIDNADCKYIFLSYNNEGILSFDEIRQILSSRGEYGVFEKDYKRFKADSNREYKANSTTEYLHYVKLASSHH